MTNKDYILSQSTGNSQRKRRGGSRHRQKRLAVRPASAHAAGTDGFVQQSRQVLDGINVSLRVSRAASIPGDTRRAKMPAANARLRGHGGGFRLGCTGTASAFLPRCERVPTTEETVPSSVRAGNAGETRCQRPCKGHGTRFVPFSLRGGLPKITAKNCALRPARGRRVRDDTGDDDKRE